MSQFTEGKFVIVAMGDMASGKTVALQKIEQMLEKEGYAVKRGLPSDRKREHALTVSWKAT